MIKHLLFIIFSLFIISCDGGMSISYHSGSGTGCGDSIALNYEYGSSGQYSYNYSDCYYCEELYYTEQERYDNCCCITGATNFNNSCSSSDATYCLWD